MNRCMYLALIFCLVAVSANAQQGISFTTDIQPVIARECTICHGPALQQSKLRLDNRKDAMRGGTSGPVIKPGDGAGSLLVKRLRGHEGLQRMPPAKPLANAQVELIQVWIDQGAVWDSDSENNEVGHWAFQPIQRLKEPEVKSSSWIRNPIDAFVLARLEEEGIAPSPETSPETLLRRTYLDLTGLPPEPHDLKQALSQQELADKLLDSEHYGERWAIPWLDQVRYADSDGYEKDQVRPHAWRYRHWVINALNEDMPFDQFTIEQLAGDLLPNASTEQRVATGFYRNTLKNREGGVDVEQFRFEEVVDRTNVVGTVWLGLSLECARCHDHKYDPISHRDYYQMFAFFNELDEVNIDAPLAGEMGPYLRAKPVFDARVQELYKKYKVREIQRSWEAKMLWAGQNPGVEHEWDTSWDIVNLYLDNGQRIIKTPWEERNQRDDFVLTSWFLSNYKRVVSGEDYNSTGFKEALNELEDLVDSFPDVSRARAVTVSQEPRISHIHAAGVWDDPAEQVQPLSPAVLPPLAATGGNPTRLDLARWLVSPENPLTARVTVNRIWQEYFGTGLVASSDNFGLRGGRPSHPLLLDWLASELIDSGWRLKHIHRLIANSATYRQSSEARANLEERDPGNRLLARQQRLRLPAELLRDSALSVAGLLNSRVGGKSIRPPLPEGVAELAYAGSVKWNESTGPDSYRRGLYILYQRTTPYPFMANFDLKERNVTSCSRERSNTPLQALNLLNDPVFFEMSQGLALRVLQEAPDESFDARLDYAYKTCLARLPRVDEKEEMLGYYIKQRELLNETPEMTSAWFPAAFKNLDQLEAASWVGVSRILLNLDEFITRE